MATERDLVTAADLDGMTPDERAAAFNDRVVIDLDRLPAAVRARIESTGARLAEEIRPASGDAAS